MLLALLCLLLSTCQPLSTVRGQRRQLLQNDCKIKLFGFGRFRWIYVDCVAVVISKYGPGSEGAANVVASEVIKGGGGVVVFEAVDFSEEIPEAAAVENLGEGAKLCFRKKPHTFLKKSQTQQQHFRNTFSRGTVDVLYC